jgi:hypothetical protein
MVNELNLNPKERVGEILGISEEFGRMAIINYLLTELSEHANHKRFDDKCYWKEVQEEFCSRVIQFKKKEW